MGNVSLEELFGQSLPKAGWNTLFHYQCQWIIRWRLFANVNTLSTIVCKWNEARSWRKEEGTMWIKPQVKHNLLNIYKIRLQRKKRKSMTWTSTNRINKPKYTFVSASLAPHTGWWPPDCWSSRTSGRASVASGRCARRNPGNFKS